jgi:cobalt-zinc-cadmium efflux system protein
LGGLFTGSVAIISDAIHDLGDALSIGISYHLEKKSKKNADKQFTFGYGRYSVLGALITNTILVLGSVLVIIGSIKKVFEPIEINHDGMLLFAVIGTLINLIATLITRGGNSLNQKAVNLHMLEDVLGWLVVLIGAIIIKFTHLYVVDPLLSLIVAIFIFINAVKSLLAVINIFLEKAPDDVNMREVKSKILSINSISNIHDLHIWSIDGVNHYATVHIVTNNPTKEMKDAVREIFKEFKIIHSTIQIEKPEEKCSEKHAHIICR